MADRTVITLDGVFLRHEDHLTYGPLDLKLEKGKGALVLANDLGLMRRLMKCCQGTESPQGGRVSWWPDLDHDRGDYWRLYGFYRQIGYIDRLSQLLGARTLMENMVLYFLYAGKSNPEALARPVLDLFGLAGYENLRADDLPEPQRRLALYALAFCKKPRLLLLERPAQFLDRDFDQVWDWVLKRAADSGLAYIVFDRTRIPYNREDFTVFGTFSPGRV